MCQDSNQSQRTTQPFSQIQSLEFEKGLLLHLVCRFEGNRWGQCRDCKLFHIKDRKCLEGRGGINLMCGALLTQTSEGFTVGLIRGHHVPISANLRAPLLLSGCGQEGPGITDNAAFPHFIIYCIDSFCHVYQKTLCAIPSNHTIKPHTSVSAKCEMPECRIQYYSIIYKIHWLAGRQLLQEWPCVWGGLSQ